jgi:GNAT superfamily N-acetyltransferase
MTTLVSPEKSGQPIELKTRDGLIIDLRAVRAEDEPALLTFFEGVSPLDRRFRFLAAADHVSHDQLEPLLHADHFRSESFIAFERESGALVASGLLACDNALDTAELAVSVREDYRGRGVGWAMLDLLSKEAQKRGVRRAISIESRENHAAIELEREKGFVPEPLEGEPSLVQLVKTFR